MNGVVRVGLDDLIRKIFARIDHVELPETEQVIRKGEPLFTLQYGEYSLTIPSPISGKITSINSEHAEHPEWLAIKPFELSWMCGIEPSNLAGELPGLKIGLDSVNWYQQEIDRFSELSSRYSEGAAQFDSNETGENEQIRNSENLEILARYTEPFLKN